MQDCNGARHGSGLQQDVMVAGGTVFLDILIWRVPHAAISASLAAHAGGERDMMVPPLMRLVGHAGSVHR